ncbi:hypothetical protein C7271_12605 [filamentous cyanobacterium CCP5]|nr:hypothetical protein C7271_12605 [filamentous cyanobacterium CCP5]
MFPLQSTGVVIKPITDGCAGLVNFKSIPWRAKLYQVSGGGPIADGQPVVIVGREGNVLLVEPA